MLQLPALKALDCEMASGWLSIWLNQPQTRNALSEELTGELMFILNAVADDRSVRGITLRGRGGVFCAGGDLRAFQSGHQGSNVSRDATIAMSKRGAEIFSRVNTMPQVVVAVVEGAAMAGGFGLACCADVVICDAGARFAMTETAIGLTPAQISPFVIQKLGYARARRLMLTAARFGALEAQALGFADELADGPEALAEKEKDIRKRVLACAPGAVADLKRLLHALPGLDRDATVQLAAENFADRLMSDEGREGIASFLEKRKPRWVEEP